MPTLTNALLTERFSQAFTWANTLHATQTRGKGGGVAAPYIVHLMGVCNLVLRDGGNENEAIAALLHDAVEDQGGLPLLAEIRKRFGDEVADLVWSATDSAEEAGAAKRPWIDRKTEHLAHLKTASRQTRRLIAADKLDNVRDLVLALRARKPEEVWPAFKSGKDGALWYYDQVLLTLKQDQDSTIVQELERVVATLKQLA